MCRSGGKTCLPISTCHAARGANYTKAKGQNVGFEKKCFLAVKETFLAYRGGGGGGGGLRAVGSH
jgi:hypothetical protein